MITFQYSKKITENNKIKTFSGISETGIFGENILNTEIQLRLTLYFAMS